MSAGMNSPLISTERPGIYEDPITGAMIEASNLRDGALYDTAQVVTPFAAGDELIFFRDLAFPAGVYKDRRYTNMTTPAQMPSGWAMVVFGISFSVLQMETAPASGLFTTPEDVLRIMYEGVGRLRTGDEKTERELPLRMFPDPYGLTGIVTRTGPAATDFSIINNGIPSMGAYVPLENYIVLASELTFAGRFRAPGGLILDNNCMIQMTLHGKISSPLR